MIHVWRLSEVGPDNLGLACTDDGLLLGYTSLIERRGDCFVVRERGETERLLKRAYRGEPPLDRLMSGLATVASALNANDQCLARIAAVHLEIPDLGSTAARDVLAAEDALIKYARDEATGDANWNPAMHPRTGAPPNPGWFAPTDGTNRESSRSELSGSESRTRFAESQNVSHSADAAPLPHPDWVKLPPGEYVDELADFVEWLANAKPEDEKAIRAEIKRYYYDVGDTTGGDALNRALSDVLQPGTTTADRQSVAAFVAHYAQTDPAKIGFDRELLSGVALFLSPWLLRRPLPESALVPPEIEFETTAIELSANQRAAIWKLGPTTRGKVIDRIFRSGKLHELSRTIDDFVDGNVISNKSIDLNAATYQKFEGLLSRINKCLNELEPYSGTEWGGDYILPSDIAGKVLRIIIPEGSMTEIQREAIKAATKISRSKNMRLIVREF